MNLLQLPLNLHEALSGSDLSTDLKVALLKKPETYPFPVDHVESVETHMSWVFLAGKYVFKLKKPVRLDLLDFTTLDARYQNCLEEVRLNQELARGVYLGVVPVTAVEDGKIELDGNGNPIDWLVWMKRLPEEKMLDELIRRNQLRPDDLKRAALMLSAFYMRSSPVGISPMSYVSWISKNILNERRKLLHPDFKLEQKRVNDIADDLISFIHGHLALLESRAEDGRIIEVHGDLRPEHVYLGPEPCFIDRLEFNRSLRIQDIAEELSFLALECDMLGQQAVGEVFIQTYAGQSGDRLSEELIAFYKAKRALHRARISIRHLTSPFYKAANEKWAAICDNYLKAAELYIQGLAIV